MKISYNWLQNFLELKQSPEEVAALLTDCGLEVEAIERFESIKGGLKDLLIAEVVDCEAHPNADRLKLTKVNYGASEPLSIVCGAPNVAKGQKVLLAPVGATIFPLDAEPFEIKKAKIRGESSEGMLCAEDEVGMGASHEGIMVLANDAKPGTPAATYFNVQTDHVFEIGLTPNRADAMSHLGVARDLLAVLKSKKLVAEDTALCWNPKEKIHPDTEELPIELEVRNPEACPRYLGVCLSDVEVKPSPSWLQNKLKSLGLKPINNVVDATNYILHHLGQPLHAFDYDKITNAKVVVRTASEGESFVSLDGENRSMNANDLMICNDQEAMCIAGVFGGLQSGVTNTSRRIFIESAYFDPVFIRKTAKRQGLSTDASFRYERGIDPHITRAALYEALELLKELTGAKVASKVLEFYPKPIENFVVSYNFESSKALIGQEIPKEDVKAILRSLDIEVLEEGTTELKLQVPAYRVDVRREADVVEEVLRIYGYNQIETPSKMSLSINPAPKVDFEALKNRCADLLVSGGFIECMSNSLSAKADYDDKDMETLVPILNPLSSELNVMRKDLIFDLLRASALNQKHRNKDLKLFEFGKNYRKDEEKYLENEQLAILISGDFDEELWDSPKRNSSFYLLKAQVEKIFKSLGLESLFTQAPAENEEYLDLALHFLHKKRVIARVGTVKDALLKRAEAKGPIYFTSIDWSYLMKLCLNHHVSVNDIPKYQEVRRDLALLVDKHVSFSALEKLAFDADRKILREVSLFDVYEGKNLEAGKKSYALKYTLRDNDATLTDERVDKVIKRIFEAYQRELNAELRSGQL